MHLFTKGSAYILFSEKFKYYPILGKKNDKVIMDFIYKGKNDEEYESLKNVLDGFVKNTDKTIKVG